MGGLFGALGEAEEVRGGGQFADGIGSGRRGALGSPQGTIGDGANALALFIILLAVVRQMALDDGAEPGRAVDDFTGVSVADGVH